MNPHRAPQRSYVCLNPNCDYFDDVRQVSLQHIGAGLYLACPPATVICECGTLAKLLHYVPTDALKKMAD